mmetsp:Transcript_38242/g.68950  ORF Transcript_38242/g.68950 Transcript_38242/m.68950 type:complete len:117 (-) Transcript_38242:59-409(-)
MTSPAAVSGNCSADTDIGNTIPKHLAQHLALLLDVIHSQRWSAFENIVLSNPSVFRMICDAIPKIEELRACLRYDPPLEIVAKMVKMFPDPTGVLQICKRGVIMAGGVMHGGSKRK